PKNFLAFSDPMTDETPFQDTLDELASFIKLVRRERLLDQYFDTCAVFADWLEEQGDWRAGGYRWISQNRKMPRQGFMTWDWWRFGDTWRTAEHLPPDLWDRLPGRPITPQTRYKAYPSRRDAESALCKALILLEADQ